MSELKEQAIRGAAGTLRGALNDSAHHLEKRAPSSGHDYRMTLLLVAGASFVAGFLWAKTRAQNF